MHNSNYVYKNRRHINKPSIPVPIISSSEYVNGKTDY